MQVFRDNEQNRHCYVSPSVHSLGTCWFTKVVRSVSLSFLSVRLSSGFNCAVAGRPSKHETSTQCWANVGPPSTTLSQHYPVLGYRVVFGAGLGPKYSVLRYFGTRVLIFQYSLVLSTRTFKKNMYSYLYSSTFRNKSTFNEYLRVLCEYLPC